MTEVPLFRAPPRKARDTQKKTGSYSSRWAARPFHTSNGGRTSRSIDLSSSFESIWERSSSHRQRVSGGMHEDGAVDPQHEQTELAERLRSLWQRAFAPNRSHRDVEACGGSQRQQMERLRRRASCAGQRGWDGEAEPLGGLPRLLQRDFLLLPVMQPRRS